MRRELHETLSKLSQKLIKLKQESVSTGSYREARTVNALDKWAQENGMSGGEVRNHLVNACHFGESGAEGALGEISVFSGKALGEKLARAGELLEALAHKQEPRRTGSYGFW